MTTRQSNVGPAIASLLLPGLGQLLQSRGGAGLLFFLGTAVGLVLCVFPGAIVWIWAVVDAAVYRGAGG